MSHITDSPAKRRLRSLLAEPKCLVIGPITLSTGRESNYYFDCKRVTLNPEGASLVADVFLAELRALQPKPDAIGGLTHGADPIVFAVMMRALEQGWSLPSFYVRKFQKEHGTRRRVENAPSKGARVVVIDDVVTTGSSVLQAVAAMQETGCQVSAVLTLVDRNEGGAEAINDSGISDYRPLFRVSDFPEISESDKCPTTTSEQLSAGVST